MREGRSLIVASLDHNQTAELYVVRLELDGLAARLAARHATDEEIRVLAQMVEIDRERLGDLQTLALSNRQFHKQVHLASHNRYLVQQLDLVHRSMARWRRPRSPSRGGARRRWRNTPKSSRRSRRATARRRTPR